MHDSLDFAGWHLQHMETFESVRLSRRERCKSRQNCHKYPAGSRFFDRVRCDSGMDAGVPFATVSKKFGWILSAW
eukprot:910328-Pleurochrysis_carterae.AAC.1